jgi:hypothetical protein
VAETAGQPRRLRRPRPAPVEATRAGQAAVAAPHPLHLLNRAVGNRAAQRLLRSARPPAWLVVGQQPTLGNRAVQRLLAAAPPSGPLRRTIQQDLANLDLDRQNIQDPLLQAILAEVLAVSRQRNVTAAYGPSAEESHVLPHGAHGSGRTYDVVIDDQQIRDPTHRQSYVLHELLHVSADSKYAINARNINAAENLIADARNSPQYEEAQMKYMWEVIDDLDRTVDDEVGRRAVPASLGEHIKRRLQRAGGRANMEFDTVLSELLYYVTKQNIDTGTQTYTKIRDLAQRAYDRRHHGVPMLPKSSCFITTACVVARGLPDDCEELTVLRRFRDGYLRRRRDGEEQIAEYYCIAPAIVAAIAARPDAARVFERLFAEIQDCVRLIKDRRHEAALHRYASLVLELHDDCLGPGVAPAAGRGAATLSRATPARAGAAAAPSLGRAGAGARAG